MDIKKPTPGKVIQREVYWSEVAPDPLPTWAFDFISVHQHSCDGKYSLLSPMRLVEPSGQRPEFEQERFERKAEAVARAKGLAKQYNLFTVDCC